MDIAADKLSDIGRYAKSLAEKLGRNCEVSTTTHPGGPGITRSDLPVINKTDLAPYVGASLEAMERDAKRMRGRAVIRLQQSARGTSRRGDRPFY